jgi:hypothetical protein
VTSRQLVWDDPKVLELLGQCVPVADQLDHLESGTDFESRFLQKVKKQSHAYYSYQGIYLAAPDGTLMAGSHEAVHDMKKIEDILQKGMAKWQKLPAKDRLLSGEEFARAVAERGDRGGRGQKQYPRAGLVLRLFCRDLPGGPPQHPAFKKAWNSDFAWFRKEEALALLPPELTPGSKQAVRRDLVERLARFHLIDAVRGSGAPYPKEAVEEARLTAEVVAVTGDRVSLRFDGRTRTSQTGKFFTQDTIGTAWKAPPVQSRGYDAKLLGRAVYDRKGQQFVSFELLAAGDRWGATSENGRVADGEVCLRPAPMGVFFELAGSSLAERVPPVHLGGYGWK